MEDQNDIIKNVGKSLTAVNIITVFVVGLLVVGLFWYFGKEDKNTSIQTTEEAVEVLSQTPEVQIETNPVKKVPDLNPVEKTNPFKTTNPFE